MNETTNPPNRNSDFQNNLKMKTEHEIKNELKVVNQLHSTMRQLGISKKLWELVELDLKESYGYARFIRPRDKKKHPTEQIHMEFPGFFFDPVTMEISQINYPTFN